VGKLGTYGWLAFILLGWTCRVARRNAARTSVAEIDGVQSSPRASKTLKGGWSLVGPDLGFPILTG
jgi:hypothetical protein